MLHHFTEEFSWIFATTNLLNNDWYQKMWINFMRKTMRWWKPKRDCDCYRLNESHQLTVWCINYSQLSGNSEVWCGVIRKNYYLPSRNVKERTHKDATMFPRNFPIRWAKKFSLNSIRIRDSLIVLIIISQLRLVIKYLVAACEWILNANVITIDNNKSDSRKIMVNV